MGCHRSGNILALFGNIALFDFKPMLLDTLHAKEAIASALHLEVCEKVFNNIDDAAREFGLRPIGDNWRGIDRDTAARVLFALLIHDMAFSSPRMSEEVAVRACEEFLSNFSPDSWFFTNGQWEDGRTKSEHGNCSFGPSWTPATDATFDGGVIVLGHARSGVLWLEDED